MENNTTFKRFCKFISNRDLFKILNEIHFNSESFKKDIKQHFSENGIRGIEIYRHKGNVLVIFETAESFNLESYYNKFKQDDAGSTLFPFQVFFCTNRKDNNSPYEFLERIYELDQEHEYDSIEGQLKSTNYKKFKRFCKVLQLEPYPELLQKYKKVHSKGAAWPEVTRGMKEVGIKDMEIYLNGYTVFMIMETEPEFDHDDAMERLALQKEQKAWEAYVSQFQKTSTHLDAKDKWIIMNLSFKINANEVFSYVDSLG